MNAAVLNPFDPWSLYPSFIKLVAANLTSRARYKHTSLVVFSPSFWYQNAMRKTTTPSEEIPGEYADNYRLSQEAREKKFDSCSMEAKAVENKACFRKQTANSTAKEK